MNEIKKRALIISCFDWYEKRIEPIAGILSSNYEVTILTSDYDHLRKKEVKAKHSACTYIHVIPYKKNLSIKRILSHLQFGMTVRWFLKNNNPDLIYLLVPPNNTAFYCKKYKEKHMDTKFIVDIIDLWPESMPSEFLKKTMFGTVWKKIRNDSVKSSDLIITECELFKKELIDVIGNKLAMTNYLFKKTDAILNYKYSNSEQTERKQKEIVLGYVGSINNIIDIAQINGILSSLTTAGFNIICKIIGDGERKEEFIKMLLEYSEVEYFGTIFDEQEKYKILNSCDFGINIMKRSVKVGLTIKSIDYFSYGLPIINNIQGDTWNMVNRFHLGINIDDDYDGLVKSLMSQSFDRSNIRQTFNDYFSRNAFVKSTRKALNLIGVYDG